MKRRFTNAHKTYIAPTHRAQTKLEEIGLTLNLKWKCPHCKTYTEGEHTPSFCTGCGRKYPRLESMNISKIR